MELITAVISSMIQAPGASGRIQTLDHRIVSRVVYHYAIELLEQKYSFNLETSVANVIKLFTAVIMSLSA
jgi:hypothetical protein